MDAKGVVIVGGTGVVGTRVVHHLLARTDVARVVAMGRRALPDQPARFVSTIVDLQDPAAVAAAIPAGLTVAVSALGTTMKQAGSKDAFRAVDHDAVVTFAAAALSKGVPRFVLVSSMGASSRSGNFYLRTKGETEDAVAALGYPQLTVLRPSFIDDEGARTERRMGERLLLPVARAAFALFGRQSRYAPVRADAIARALLRVAFDSTNERRRAIESDQIHRLGEAPPA